MDKVEMTVNGKPALVSAVSLDGALLDLGFDGVRVATALNGAFVPAGKRATTPICAGDRLEIVSARQGG